MRTAIEMVMPRLRELTTVPVVRRVPMDRLARFVRVDQSPPVRFTPVADRAVVIVQVYGAAGDLDWVVEEVSRLRASFVHDWHCLDPDVVGWDEVQGPHEFPDPDDSGIVRWQFSGTVVFTLAD